MTSSITKKGKGANADAVKVTPFSLAWSVFCVYSFLSFSRAVNRQLKTYRLALVTKKGKGANADAVKVTPFSLAWSVFCVYSFLSFSRAVNRQLKTYIGFWFSECERRQRRKGSREARCML